MLKYPILGALVLLLVFLFLSSPHIFSLTFSGKTLLLPEETSLAGFHAGYTVFGMIDDESRPALIGIGMRNPEEKQVPPIHILREGDSIYSIAKEYDISFYDLLKANRISDPKSLRTGDTINIFPATDVSPAAHVEGNRQDTRLLPEEISVSANSGRGYAPLAVSFSLDTPIPEGAASFMWVLGNDRYAFEKNPTFTYRKTGRFEVFLILTDKDHHEVVSNTLSIEVMPKTTKKVRIESNTPRFVTVGEINNIIDLSEVLGNDVSFESGNATLIQAPNVLQHIGENKFLTTSGGYSRAIVQTEKEKHTMYLFISPFPSKHSYDPPYNWYKTQFATGVNGNCGPACVAMAIHWATARDIPVEKVRAEIGMPYRDGAISFDNMIRSFGRHGVEVDRKTISGNDDIFRIIDRGNIVIILFNTGKISRTKGDRTTNIVGRYYEDRVGHYVIVKGYTLDRKYFIVYDPIPSDWKTNSARYADGTSMLGKNRYYSASELMRSIRDNVLEVIR
ncbi:MAG: LysM peptidoglycan-binding domain-containing protein [Spirochaetales bacterium]|nr:LysM peptidoglycan-binding domain-containing protein [Spirochaetales bacterium]